MHEGITTIWGEYAGCTYSPEVIPSFDACRPPLHARRGGEAWVLPHRFFFRDNRVFYDGKLRLTRCFVENAVILLRKKVFLYR